MARSPFILCTRKLKDGTFWYARFYDPENQTRYLVRSTGIPYTEKKGNNRIKANDAAEKILETLFSNQQDPLFLEYVLSFWSEDSQYLKKKVLADKKPLSAYYVKMNQAGIKKYVCSYKRFHQLKISCITTAMIEDWKLYCLENKVGSRRVNAVLQSIRIPIRYLYERHEIQSNPFENVKPVKDCPKEKGILTLDEFSALLVIEEEDHEIILAIRLAALCGMRRGEVRGIQWQDIDFQNNQIHICHNYIDNEGLKSCKWDSKRSVMMTEMIRTLLQSMQQDHGSYAPDAFVIRMTGSDLLPISDSAIRTGFARMLQKIGISKEQQKARNLSFHSLRHGFISLARASGISDIEVQALAGHRSAEMMNHYSHGSQIIDFKTSKEKLEMKINGNVEKKLIQTSIG